MSHLRDRSPLLALDRFEDGNLAPIAEARAACEALSHVLKAEEAQLSEVMECIASSRLLDVPSLLSSTDDGPEQKAAWAEAMRSPVPCLGHYHRYAAGNGRFGTHHGVKGLEFPRVLAVLSDQEARGRGVSYDKLFGPEGQGDAVAATRHLFYVICTRARQGLAVVLHTEACDVVQDIVVKRGWFTSEEVVCLNVPH
jgi:DNA helicase-2/ATP-dependent DNA helicase PcrA